MTGPVPAFSWSVPASRQGAQRHQDLILGMVVDLDGPESAGPTTESNSHTPMSVPSGSRVPVAYQQLDPGAIFQVFDVLAKARTACKSSLSNDCNISIKFIKNCPIRSRSIWWSGAHCNHSYCEDNKGGQCNCCKGTTRSALADLRPQRVDALYLLFEVSTKLQPTSQRCRRSCSHRRFGYRDLV